VYRYDGGPGGVRTHSQVNWDLVVKCASEVPVKNWLTYYFINRVRGERTKECELMCDVCRHRGRGRYLFIFI
jgi:hypothetical protein